MTPLRDIVLEHPQWMAIACVAWIAIAIWIVSLIGWMIQGDVDVLFGVLGIGVALILGYFSFVPPIETLRPFMAVAVIVTVIVFPMLRQSLNQRALAAIDVEAVENAYEILRQKPDNHMMRFKIGRLLVERGHIGPGLAIAGEALKGMPENLFTEEHRMFGRWRRQNPQANPNETLICVNCGHQNPGGALECERCGQPHILDVMRGRWVGRQFAKKLLTGWIVGVIALAGIPLASLLPPIPAIIAIICLMAGVIVVLWLVFRPVRENSGA